MSLILGLLRLAVGLAAAGLSVVAIAAWFGFLVPFFDLFNHFQVVLIAGLMDIIIAGIIIAGLPGSALWAVGLLVGINLLFGGATLIGVALAAHAAD